MHNFAFLDGFVVKISIENIGKNEKYNTIVEEQVNIEKDALVQECYFGNFVRAIVLPETVDGARAKAHFTHCVLTIALPQPDNRKTRVNDIAED